ncbi:ribbon-helix-helix domain-containing protein [Patescibacteria group bacterium]|nr:ribbon-helix-helix domain-containing protein [Patescibacteria group bacterium]
MSSVSISLPTKQLTSVDKLVEEYGFANRSEFLRSALRLMLYNPTLVERAATFPFVAPQEYSVKKIMADFKKTKKYPSRFLKDLEEGLKESDFFTE